VRRGLDPKISAWIWLKSKPLVIKLMCTSVEKAMMKSVASSIKRGPNLRLIKTQFGLI